MATYRWTVVGAGPAGIIAVGRLLDHGVEPTEIAWIDPDFAAGDLGGKWRAVHSNTVASLFMAYLNASPSFGFRGAPPFKLTDVEPDETCLLDLVAEPLVWISERLRRRVVTMRTTATDLQLHHSQWTIETGEGAITSERVILAVGATPRKLDYPGLTEVPLDVVLDPEKLAKQSLDGATVAVFGSSHSTMIALPHLLDQPVERVVNFYRSPLRFAVAVGDWTLYDDIGLKGEAARWAKTNIDGVYPDRLDRVPISSPDFEERLAQCDHVVYTIGFERRRLPRTPQWQRIDYDPTNGIIAPGLFGFGIAFPESHTNPLGLTEHRVGLYKFMQYLDTVLPLWMRYGA
ncbi:FAD-dependent oxidoreductase [Mycobacterium sp. NPDC048908]|uniref:FAD-dependent oxidoreductase n=1 Tax=Mycobacterium sp. NPDC048908 TaxID=3364292 RepID=UPI00371DDACF